MEKAFSLENGLKSLIKNTETAACPEGGSVQCLLGVENSVSDFTGELDADPAILVHETNDDRDREPDRAEADTEDSVSDVFASQCRKIIVKSVGENREGQPQDRPEDFHEWSP